MKTLLLIFLPLSAFAQNGSITVQIVDEDGFEIPMAKVILKNEVDSVYRFKTDLEGRLKVDNLSPGTYSLKAVSIGKDTTKIECIVLGEDTLIDMGKIDLIDNGLIICDLGCWPPPIFRDNDFRKPFKKDFIGTREFYESPLRQLVGPDQTTGILMVDFQEAQLVRGSRRGDVEVFIDGVKIIGSTEIPKSSFHSAEVYYGGVPAKYGDTTGGLVLIKTKSYFDLYYEYKSRNY